MISRVCLKRIVFSIAAASAVALYGPVPFAAAQSAGERTAQAPSASRPSLDYEFFKTRVEPIFIKKRWPDHSRCYICHEISRHGGGPLSLAAIPAGASFWTEEQSRHNFEVVSNLVIPGDPLSRLFLLMTLAAEASGLPASPRGGTHSAV